MGVRTFRSPQLTPLICNFSSVCQPKALQGHGGNFHEGGSRGVNLQFNHLPCTMSSESEPSPGTCKEKYTALDYLTCHQGGEMHKPSCRTALKYPLGVCNTAETAGEWDSSCKSSWGLFLVLIPSTCCGRTCMKGQKPEFLV